MAKVNLFSSKAISIFVVLHERNHSILEWQEVAAGVVTALPSLHQLPES